MRLKKLIVAAGGVLYRLDGDELLCAVIKSAKHNAWGLPKGKVDERDSSLLATAMREVQEETGCKVEPMGYAGSFRYRVTGGLKIVAFWHMKVLQENWRPLYDDILEIKWFPLSEAVTILRRAEERRFLCRIFELTETQSPKSDRRNLIFPVHEDNYSASTELRMAGESWQ